MGCVFYSLSHASLAVRKWNSWILGWTYSRIVVNFWSIGPRRRKLLVYWRAARFSLLIGWTKEVHLLLEKGRKCIFWSTERGKMQFHKHWYGDWYYGTSNMALVIPKLTSVEFVIQTKKWNTTIEQTVMESWFDKEEMHRERPTYISMEVSKCLSSSAKLPVVSSTWLWGKICLVVVCSQLL